MDPVALVGRFTGVGVWTVVLLLGLTLIKGWPALTKLRNEADGSLRRDLLERVKELEAQQKTDRAAFEAELRAERLTCDERLRDQANAHDKAIAELNGRIDGLMRNIAQNSQSSAYLLGAEHLRLTPPHGEGETDR